MITVENLIFEYPGKRAIDDVSFTIEEGSITALVGPNGAGKTTLMRCIAGLDEPFAGSVRVNGIDVEEHPRKVHKFIGYLSDFFGVYHNLTVRQCLTFIGKLHQLQGKALDEHIDRAVALMQLGQYINTKAGNLSRGWRQRLGIAQAIIHQPKLILLDEPASGLDPEARISLSELFKGLRDEGMTIMVSSHILSELEDYCTDMLILREGKVTDYQHAGQVGDGKSALSLTLTLSENADAYYTILEQFEGVSEVDANDKIVTFLLQGGESEQQALLKHLVQQDVPVISLNKREKKLQDVYMSLSKKGS